MSEILERVARAIWTQRTGNPDPSWTPSSECYQDARAAIEAMREPSDDMISAGHEADPAEVTVTLVWQAMVDSALRE